ncbi:MAG: MarR family transcriptional regulator [Thermoleophilia bacterium]
MTRVHQGSSAPTGTASWRALEPATESLIAAGAELGRLLDHIARRSGSLTFAQYQLLGALRGAHPQPLEPWELGRALGAGSAQVTALLDHLERAGLLVRQAHEHDRRRRLVRLTDMGVERVEQVGRHITAVERMVFERAGDADQLKHLAPTADRLRAVLSELLASDLSFSLDADPGRRPGADAPI